VLFLQAAHRAGPFVTYGTVSYESDREKFPPDPIQSFPKLQRRFDLVPDALKGGGDAVGNVFIVDDEKDALRDVESVIGGCAFLVHKLP
jgi:hypothetical protein